MGFKGDYHRFPYQDLSQKEKILAKLNSVSTVWLTIKL